MLTSYTIPGGKELWLSFTREEPHGLTRAIVVHRGAFERELFNALPQTRTRRFDQLDFSREVNTDALYAAWGPPDATFGFGATYWDYLMENGETVSVRTHGTAVLYTP